MEFGKHLSKGIWAFADKGLPAFYGVAYIFLVQRVLAEDQYGAWVVIWAVYLMLTAFCYTLAFQPMMKFVAEKEEHGGYIVAGFVVAFAFYAIVSAALIVFKQSCIELLDPKHSPVLVEEWGYLPIMLFATLVRVLVLSLFQARYAVQKIFWVDAVYFVGTVILIEVVSHMHEFSSAHDLVMINLVGLTISSLVAVITMLPVLPKKIVFRRAEVIELIQFGKFLFGSNAIYAIFAQLDVFFVSSYAGVTGAALYNIAKTLNRIFDMVSQVLQMFLLPFSSKAYAQNEKNKLLVTAEKAICFSTILLLPVFLVMLLFPHQILQILYRGRYQEAAPLMQIFSFIALVLPWNGTISTYYVGMGKVKPAFYLGFVLLGLAFVAYWIFAPWLGVLGISLAYVLTFFLITVIIWFVLYKDLPLSPVNVVRRVNDVWEFARKKSLW